MPSLLPPTLTPFFSLLLSGKPFHSQDKHVCTKHSYSHTHQARQALSPSLISSPPCWFLLCAAPSPSASPSLSPCLRLPLPFPFHLHLCLAQSSSIYADIYIGWAPVEPNRAMAFYVGRHTLSKFPSRTPPPPSPCTPSPPLLLLFRCCLSSLLMLLLSICVADTCSLRATTDSFITRVMNTLTHSHTHSHTLASYRY